MDRGVRFIYRGELNGLDYTIPAIQLTTSPAISSVNGINDGLIVNCLMGEFQNQFLIGRSYDLWVFLDTIYPTLHYAKNILSGRMPRAPSVQDGYERTLLLSYRGCGGLFGNSNQSSFLPIDSRFTYIASAGNALSDTLTTQADWQSGIFIASGSGASFR